MTSLIKVSYVVAVVTGIASTLATVGSSFFVAMGDTLVGVADFGRPERLSATLIISSKSVILSMLVVVAAASAGYKMISIYNPKAHI
jgi:hypothetical protein